MTAALDPAPTPAEPAAQTAPRPPRRRGRLPLLFWITGGLALLVGLYAALGFWVAPKVIKSQTISQIAERYHRKAALAAVRLNPFTLQLEADDFRLPDADGRTLIGFHHLIVRFAAASLWRGGPEFETIRLDDPQVRLVRRANGRLNVQDLLPPPAPKPAKPAKPLRVVIDHLGLRGGSLELTDLDRATPVTKLFTALRFRLDDFSTERDGAAYVLKAATPRGERLAWRGQVGLAPLASAGSFSLTDVQVQPLAELTPDALPFGVKGGSLSLTGAYRFGLNGQRLTLGVDVANLRLLQTALRARGADADWIILPEIAIAQVHVDVPTRAVSVGRIEADRPKVTAWTERGGGLNLARYAGPPAKGPAPAAGPAWTVGLPDLRIHGGELAFEDRAAPKPVRMTATPIELAITGLALPLKAPIQIEASTGLEGGGRLAAKGSVGLTPVTADLDVDVADVGLPRFQPYIDDAVSLKLLSGRASAKGHLAYDAAALVRFDGAARIDSLHTVDKDLGQDFVNWRALAFDGVQVRTKPLGVKVRQVSAQAPYARVVIGPNYVMNITDVLSPKGAARPATPTPAASKDLTLTAGDVAPPAAAPATPRATPAPHAALPIEIGLVTIHGGRMDFSDLTVAPHFAAGIQALEGTVKGLSGRQDARAAVDLNGQVDRFAPVKIDGQVNYFAARSYTDLTMAFHNMELTTFSPYSGKFAGYRIDKGKLNVDLHYKIDDQKLDAEHHVVINQLLLGEKVDSAESVKLPVKLIVALLKDRHGVIDVPINISGTLDDPKFKLWPLIWKIVDNLLVKIATSPFDLLGKLVGGGPELQYVDFAPGAAALDEADRQKIAGLAKALAERPAVNLEIPLPLDPARDRPVLIEARFKAELTAATAQRLGKHATEPGAVDAALAAPKTRRAILEALYRQQMGAKPDIPKPQAAPGGPKPDADQAAARWLEEKLRARVSVSEQELQQLARARAEAVQAALLGDGQIDPSRVFVVTAPPLTASEGPVRMTLSLT